MGCSSSNEKELQSNSNINNRYQQREHNSRERDLEPYLQSKINPSFNFPEIDKETYIGTGIKVKIQILKMMKSHLYLLKNQKPKKMIKLKMI